MNLILSLENFLTYLRLHKGRSIRTLEQYEFHLWRFFTYLEPELRSGSTEDKKRSEDTGKIYWNHREVFLDTNAEKR